jgi:hypothetical protein
MDLATLKANLKTELGKQKVRDELMVTKALIKTLDTLVEALVDRLRNPNKAFGAIGKPAPPAEGDVTFNKCKDEIGKVLKSALFQRSSIVKLAGPEPPQYEQLRTLLPSGGSEPEKYSNPYANFLHPMSKFIIMIKAGGYPSCAPYKRVMNLLMTTTTGDKYNFNFDGLLTEISRALKPFKDAKEKVAIDEIIDMALALSVLDAKRDMPQVPTGSVSAPSLPDPTVDVSETELETDLTTAPSAAVGATPVYKTPLKEYELRYIQNVLIPKTLALAKTKGRVLTDQQARIIAENAYRKKYNKLGGRTKTYRNKKSHRKSRKVRRI